MEIKLLTNNKSKKKIKSIIEKIDDNNKKYIKLWLDETNNVKSFILYENKTIKTFALLHKLDFDPLNKHENPYILDFIYTFKQYRRNNLAYKLLLNMKDKNNITAFCNNNESSMLFKKAGYVEYDIFPIPTFRYP